MSATVQTLRPPSKPLMFLEGRSIHELGAFLGALPLLSLAPKGDGHPVLVLPGLVASDTSTRPLRSFLKGHGHAVSGWRQGRNLGRRPARHAHLVQELSNKHGRKGGKGRKDSDRAVRSCRKASPANLAEVTPVLSGHFSRRDSVYSISIIPRIGPLLRFTLLDYLRLPLRYPFVQLSEFLPDPLGGSGFFGF